MGDLSAKWVKAKGRSDRRNDIAQKDALSPKEAAALRTIRSEAKQNDSYLASGGKGGLPPSLILGIFRRDRWRCKTCGELGSKENGGLSAHHKAGIVESKWLSHMGHANKPSAIVSICDRCHNELHTEARKEGIDSSQVLPEGDEGNKKYDHGQPVAHPKH